MGLFHLIFEVPAMYRMLLIGGITLAITTGSATADPETTVKARALIDAHVKAIRPLEIIAGKAWWDANTTGDKAAFQKKEDAQNRLDAALANAATFAELKAAKDAKIDDKLVSRQIDLLYLMYLEKQVDPALLKKMTAKANAVEAKFNVYRAKVNGQELADSKVRELLKSSTDSNLRKTVWEASKGVGKDVEADLKELVKLRNQAATQLGFKNFHAMMLFINEQEGVELVKLFDELDDLTREPYAKAKAEIDEKLAANAGVKVADLMPWHYHDSFFQESPAVFDVDLDQPFKTADILELCRKFYAGIDLPIDDVIARSDLYEKKGKSPHAFCTDIDREGDVRVLANITATEYWASTMLHELGHAVYSSKNIPQSVPYVLRGEAHILTTEGVAMQFQKFSKSRAWLEKMGVKVENPAAFDATSTKVLRNELLIFSRWCQVMLRFEKAMYENPDQDLNKLWWDYVEKYQLLKRPVGRSEPDYASKIHICSAPVYYHNYMMGQLFASQVHHTIAKELYDGAAPSSVNYIGDKRVGGFMKAKIFEPARTLSWRDLMKFATGAELSAKAFALDFQAK